MKLRCSQLFVCCLRTNMAVCRVVFPALLFSLLSLAAMAQAPPSCPDNFTGGKVSLANPPGCTGSTLNFSLTGNSSGPIMMYFVERAGSPAGPFITVGANPDPTKLSATSIPGLSYYRIGVYCTVGQLYAYSDTLTFRAGPLAGNYTINSSLPESATNFTSFSAAAQVLGDCGVDGAVVFDVATTNTVYREQVLIPEIPGSSSTNTITFNGNGNTLAWASKINSAPYVLKLNGADYVTVDNLKIDATGGTYGFGIHMMNNADNNTIKNCSINADINTNSGDFAGVVINGNDTYSTDGYNALCDGNTVIHNTISGGFYGIVVCGNSSTPNNNITIADNEIRDTYNYGVRAENTNRLIIEHNNISQPTRVNLSNGTGWAFIGIYIGGNTTNARISENSIHDIAATTPGNTGTMYGIYFYYTDATASNFNIVYNNLIYNFNSSGIFYGIANGSSDYVQCFHNTISFDNTANISKSATYAFYQTVSASGLQFMNNLVSLTRGGGATNYCIYMGTAATTYESNNNDFYTGNIATTNVGYNGSARATLANWRTATGKDAASFNENPLFRRPSENNFIPNSGVINDKGTYVGVSYDVAGNVRNNSIPDIGAYEYNLLACANPPAAATVVVAENPVCTQSIVALNLLGGDLGSGLSYQWQSSSDNSQWANITGGNGIKVNVIQTQDTWYRVISTCGTDNTPSAGIKVNTLQRISGNFTINKNQASGGTNFQSFNEAWNAIRCGINGPVVFDVVAGSGPYNEQLILGPVAGSSDLNTITFNGHGNSLSYTSSSPTQRAVIKLSGAEHFIFNDLVITATGNLGSQYGYTVHLTGKASYNIIRNCKIYTDTTNTNFNYAGIAVSGSDVDATAANSGCLFNIFEDNIINGGFYGVALAANDTGTVIRRNVITNFYRFGIYRGNSDRAVIDSNLISCPTRTNTTQFYGIYVIGAQSSLNITRNRIFNPFGGNPESTEDIYGIYLTAADAIAGRETIISNNLFYNVSGQGSVYALYNNGSDRAWYFHNTINVDGAISAGSNYATYGFYQTTTAGALRFSNNIISLNRAGAGSKYAMYMNAPASVMLSDYNDLYINEELEGNKYVGYKTSEKKSMFDWQQAGYDAHSTIVDPAYVSVATNNLIPQNPVINNAGVDLAGLVNSDAVAVARNTSTPDLGAYEFTPPACVTPPVAGKVVASDSVICITTSIVLNVKGNSFGSQQTYQWQAASKKDGAFSAISGAAASPVHTIQPTETLFYRLAVTCGAMTAYSDTFRIAVNEALPGGEYIIDTNGTGHFLNFNEARIAMTCGIKGPVVFNVIPVSKVYNERLVLDSIKGTSAANTITFKGNGNTLKFASDISEERAVITLNGTDYVTFDNLKINAAEGAYGWGAWLTNNATHNTFSHCRIELPVTGTTQNYAGIVIGGTATNATSSSISNCNYNTVQADTIVGGYYGVTMHGYSSALLAGNSVIDNIITNFYMTGVFVGYSEDARIDGNDFTRPDRTESGTISVIETSYSIPGLSISKNRIHNTSDANTTNSSGFYGIELSSYNGPAEKPIVISNNLMYKIRNGSSQYGIYNGACSNVKLYHNTFSLDHTTSASTGITAAFYQFGSPTGTELKNNIFTISRGGTGDKLGIYITTSNIPFVSDNNVIWLSGNGNKYWGRYGSGTNVNFVNRSDWYTRTLADNNSKDLYPVYQDTANNNFKPTLASIDNMGVGVGVTTDIFNTGRSSVRPDVGAIEFVLAPCITPPAPGVAAVTPASGICMGTEVALSLTGNTEGGGQKYVWQRAAAATGPWTDISDSLDVSSLKYELATTDTYFRAAVVCGTGVAYSDPAILTLNAGFAAGDYTIDPAQPAGGSNFTNFKDAIAAMACGITGHVRFLVAPGMYSERVTVPKIPGTSANATVTFLSKDQVAASVALVTPCTQDSNYVVRLNSTNYIAFKHLTIVAQSENGAYGRGVEFTGTSSFDNISHCVIYTPVTGRISNTVAGVFGETLWGTDNVISHNVINNGAAGIYLNGVQKEAQRFSLDSNTFSGTYYYDIFVSYITRISASGNTITRSGMMNSTSYGILADHCDSVLNFRNNTIHISNTNTLVYGIELLSCLGDTVYNSNISGNRILAVEDNTGSISGLYIAASRYANVMNNVVNVKTTGEVESYGINAVSVRGLYMFNNSVWNQSPAAAGCAAFVSLLNVQPDVRSIPKDRLYLYNNIFANTGSGKAANIADYDGALATSDYNMYYTEGAVPLARGSYNYTTLAEWRSRYNIDYNSLFYKPVFENEWLAPALANPEVWAMHGRGVQSPVNNTDINGNGRPTTRPAGVPDLGAYEFLPTVQPLLLTATPATPAPGITQIFTLGTDTVTKVTWGTKVPATVEARRYSGVAPAGLTPGQQYMYFYTAFTTTGDEPAGHTVQQSYFDSWLGTVEKEKTLKLGMSNNAAWNINARSSADIYSNVLKDTGLARLHQFTGLTDGKEDPVPPVVISPADTSNLGTQFWTAYGHSFSFEQQNDQAMVLYFSATNKPAHIIVRVNGTSWTREYNVPAYSTVFSDSIPRMGPADARLMNEGWSDRGISIASDVPVAAYARIAPRIPTAIGQYSNSSGMTSLLPVGTYGYDYTAMAYTQNFQTNAHSWFYVVAAYDSTVVEITPSQPTFNGRPANTPFKVQLMKGEVYQVFGGNYDVENGYDITGSRVRSVINESGKCYPVAVFSGSSGTSVNCNNNVTGNIDNLFQQNLPTKAWGKRYLTTPTASSVSVALTNPAIYRVLVKDPATKVTRNGSPLSGIINNTYYQIESLSGEYIEADKPIMVAQYIPSPGTVCGYAGQGDPDMFYLTPLEAAVKETVFPRILTGRISNQYLSLIIPDEGLKTLSIDGSSGYDYAAPHTTMPGYTVVVKKWTNSLGSVVVRSDSAFTGFAYGLGDNESYAFNLGRMINGESVRTGLSNNNDTAGGINAYTCVGSPFKFRFRTSMQPDKIEWKLADVPHITPGSNVVVNNPKASDTVIINGVAYYEYSLDGNYVIDSAGDYQVNVKITSGEIEACGAMLNLVIPVKVVAAPKVDFSVAGNCAGGIVTFKGTADIFNNIDVARWSWDLGTPGAAAAHQDTAYKYAQTGTYQVKLTVTDVNGCIADTVKAVTVGDGPAVTMVSPQVVICPGTAASLEVASPVAGANYNWYNANTGGTPVHTGSSWNIPGVNGAVSYWVESELNGCVSAQRKEVAVQMAAPLETPVVKVLTTGAHEVTFGWAAINGATAYEVSLNNSAAWQTPSSGTLGLTHTVSGLGVGEEVTLKVRVIGGCEPVVSAAADTTTVTDEIFIPNSFSPNNNGPVENETFRIYGNAIKEMRLMIFNQWGEKVFESKNQNEGWDGRYKGKPQPSGVYIYVVEIVRTNNQRQLKKGTINLVR
ncbi:Ig-like domain-containing protein [Filimonas effusa]|uniref:T9SS type B sorting domain-containing protein n=1 Tax=Filimonas effusa TaxID=2508721 RepID=A0A4Q1D3P0_9BACT|nr:gliding motility-associated C-terminal domain-containing protein [Filimonas effusa]RXK82938.1 T9SS type B sorting domain-containing protein [Filimonas effusa]